MLVYLVGEGDNSRGDAAIPRTRVVDSCEVEEEAARQGCQQHHRAAGIKCLGQCGQRRGSTKCTSQSCFVHTLEVTSVFCLQA